MFIIVFRITAVLSPSSRRVPPLRGLKRMRLRSVLFVLPVKIAMFPSRSRVRESDFAFLEVEKIKW